MPPSNSRPDKIASPRVRARIEKEAKPIGSALRRLDSALAGLDTLLATDCRWVSVDDESTAIAAMGKVRAALTEIDDDDIEDRRAMPGCRGIVAVTSRAIAAAHRVNEAKVELKAAFFGLRVTAIAKQPDQDRRLRQAPPGMHRLTLTALGRPKLNLFAAYRRVPILTGAPRRVGFADQRHYTIYRTPREVIANRLQRRADANSVEDLLRVQRLPQSEDTLALLTTRRTFPNAGVWFDGFDAQGRSYVNLSTPVPILYLAAGATPAVSYRRASAGSPRACSVRAVCPVQYLTTMRVHRYYRYMNAAETNGA